MRLAPCVCAIAALAVSAAPAAAQEPGLTIDPASPTAQEYSIPLERVRRQAGPSGASREQPPTVRAAPAFGDGVVAQASAGAGGGELGAGSADGDRRRSDGAERSDRSRRSQRGSMDRLPEEIAAAAQQPGPPAGGIGTALLIGGVAALVLVAGALGGLVLRRRS